MVAGCKHLSAMIERLPISHRDKSCDMNFCGNTNHTREPSKVSDELVSTLYRSWFEYVSLCIHVVPCTERCETAMTERENWHAHEIPKLHRRKHGLDTEAIMAVVSAGMRQPELQDARN